MSASWHGRLSVLLYESSAKMVESYSHQISEVFSEAGYPNPLIKGVSPGDKLFSDDHLPSRSYFDVVICDASFGEDIPDRAGLAAITEIKRSNPGIFAIAYTVHLLDYNVCVESFDFDIYVNKVALNRPEYRKTLASQLRNKLKINTNAYISGSFSTIWPGLSRKGQNDLLRIIRKITFTEPGNTDSPGITKVTLVPELSGLSKSRVFYLQAETIGKFKCVQSVLKIAAADQTESIALLKEERKNYTRFVRWYLPYYWRPELMAEADEGSMSAICYAVVGSWEAPPRSIAQWTREGRIDVLGKAIDSIFSPDYQRWYAPANVRRNANNDHLESLYLRTWIAKGNFERHNSVISRVISNLEPNYRKQVLSENRSPANYGVRLFGQPAHNYRTCIVHGDLNTNNVFAALSSLSTEEEVAHVSFIDFANTGRGHVFVDFAVFEVNLRLNYSVDENRTLQSVIALEDEILSSGEPNRSSFAGQIRRMRLYAGQNFTDEPWCNYLYAVAAFSFGLLGSSRLSASQATVLVGVVLRTVRELTKKGYW